MRNKNKKAISRFSKVMIVLQLLVVVGTLSFIYFFAPALEYPRNNAVIEEENIKFKFRNANLILIDENPEFSSPVQINASEVREGKIYFKPGEYYWKVVGVMESRTRSFIIKSRVGLDLDENESKLKNSGNVVLNVSSENEAGISGLAILDVNVEYGVDLENDTNYRGEQYDG